MNVDCERFVVKICDEGFGYDFGGFFDLIMLENFDKVSGCGLLLIKIFMDEVEVNEMGNEIWMVKYKFVVN